MEMDFIKAKVHELYWKDNMSCTRTMLICLGELFDVTYLPQTLQCSIGLHGVGKFGAQCGLAEGGLMFIGIYYSQFGKDEAGIVSSCYHYAEAFNQKFGSLRCCELRANVSIINSDPRHMCEQLTRDAVTFTNNFIRKES